MYFLEPVASRAHYYLDCAVLLSASNEVPVDEIIPPEYRLCTICKSRKERADELDDSSRDI